MQKGSNTRFSNGVIAAVITVLFIAHAVLGSASVVAGYTSPFSVLVWVGVALIIIHVVASIATSREQLNDAERPPSVRKKRHLALKWATGIVLAALAILHVALPKGSSAGVALVMALIVALAVHLWVGSKSLLKDIGIDVRYKAVFRGVICIFALACIVAIIMGLSGVVGGVNA